MSNAPAPLPPEVIAAFERRQPIEAIKLLLRMRANAQRAAKPVTKVSPATTATSTPSPKDSTATPNGLSPGEVPHSESAFWGWVVAALVLYVCYRLFSG